MTPDHETIWLAPKCNEGCAEGRLWAPDNPWGDKCEDCEEKPVKYVRADLTEQAAQHIAQLEAQIAKLTAVKAGDVMQAHEAAVRAVAGIHPDIADTKERARAALSTFAQTVAAFETRKDVEIESLRQLLVGYSDAVETMNAAMKDGVNVHGALSAITGYESQIDEIRAAAIRVQTAG